MMEEENLGTLNNKRRNFRRQLVKEEANLGTHNDRRRKFRNTL